METYDLIILGAGPAGLAAGIYATRYNLKILIIGRELGGLAATAWKVENYPGFSSISGMDLMDKFKEHALKFGAKLILYTTVTDIKKKNGQFVVQADKNKFLARSLIMALGTQRRKLNIPGEAKFLGKGISYCAICDAAFFKNKVVGLVGGSNAAATSALLLAQHVRKVHIIHRRGKLRCDPILMQRIEKNQKIEIIYNSILKEAKGDKSLSSVIIEKEGKVKELKLDGLFVEIGSVPTKNLIKKLGIAKDENGYVKVKADMSTNIPGVFAVGDLTNATNFKQIITVAAQGAIAANSAFKYLKG